MFLLHYFNPDHLSFSPNISLYGGATFEGGADVTYCPSVEGCRAVFTLHDGSYVLDITTSNQVMTITLPIGLNTSHFQYFHCLQIRLLYQLCAKFMVNQKIVFSGKAFWLDYILVIPEKSYRASFLHFSLSDYSRKFFKECIGAGTEVTCKMFTMNVFINVLIYLYRD